MPTIEELEAQLAELVVMHGDVQARIDRLERNYRTFEQVAEVWTQRLASLEARPAGANVMSQILSIADYERRFRNFLDGAREELERQNQRYVTATAVARTRPDALDVARMNYPVSAKVGPVEDLSDDGYDGDLEEKPPGPNNPA